MAKDSKTKRVLMWVLLLVAIGGLVWAGAELSGMAKRDTADSGLAGSKMELASLETVKPSKKTPPAARSQADKYSAQLKKLSLEYNKLVEKARSEGSVKGEVTPATRDAGLASANKFRQVSDEYAAYYEKNNNPKQAKVVRNTGLARVANAEMVFNPLDSGRTSAYNKAQEELASARGDYLKEAKTELTPEELAAMKASLMPQLEELKGQVARLLTSVLSLVDQARAVASGDIGAIAGCAMQAATGDGVLGPITSLLSMVKSLGSNLATFISQVSAL